MGQKKQDSDRQADCEKQSNPRILRAGEIHPVVHSANYFTVTGDRRGPGRRRIKTVELVHVIRGRFIYKFNGERHEVNGGEILFIEPGIDHVICRDLEAGDAAVAFVHHELIPNAAWRKNDYRLKRPPWIITRVGSDTTLPELFRRAAATFKGYERLRTKILEGIVCEIWLRLIQIWREPRSQPTQRTQAMVEYLRRNLALTNGRQDLADEFLLTPEYVTSLFKKELGITPSEFILRERVLMGQRLIQEQGKTVKEAADATGFYDQYYFSRVFKRFLGFPPSQVKWGQNPT